jgi:hypothetical protein
MSMVTLAASLAAGQEIYLNRPVIWSREYKPAGTFEAFHQAQAFLGELGYTIGSMCLQDPIGFADSDKVDYIAKWYNIEAADRAKLDGVIISDDFREGGCRILFFTTPKL